MLWDATSIPKQIGPFSETPIVSPDGEWLAIPLDSGAKLVKTLAPEHEADLIANCDFGSYYGVIINDMKFYPTPSFSPDSKTIAVTGLFQSGKEPFLGKWLPKQYNPFPSDPGGSVVRVWDTESRQALLAISDCSEVRFWPDGQVLATLRDHTAIDLWKMPFRRSLLRILATAAITWLIVLSMWRGVRKAGKALLRTPFRIGLVIWWKRSREAAGIPTEPNPVTEGGLQHE